MTENRQVAHLTRKKGHNKRNARAGNKNTSGGPRLGRKDKRPTSKVSAPALPSLQAGAAALASSRRAHREKPAGSGRDFEPGQNSHDGTVFQRGPDRLPRGNMTLYFKCLYFDVRGELYRRHRGILENGTDRDVLELSKMIADRIEGTPSKKVVTTPPHVSKFTLTTRDGQETEPIAPKAERVAATPAVASPMPAEDTVILGLGHVGELVRA
jgi:hypothetical protein